MSEFELISIDSNDMQEDGSTDKPKRYHVVQPWAISTGGYDSFEAAEEAVLKDLKKNPWGNEKTIMELRTVYRGIPAGEVSIQKVDLQQLVENKSE